MTERKERVGEGDRLASARDAVEKVLAWVLTGLVGMAVLNVLWQVFTRWVLNHPSSYTEELARYLLIWVGMLGAAYASGKKMHLAIDLLPESLTGRSRHALEITIQLLVLVFAVGVEVVGGVRLVELTLRFEQTSAALNVPLGYVYLIVPMSGVLIAFFAVVSIVERARAYRGERANLKPPDRSTTLPID